MQLHQGPEPSRSGNLSRWTCRGAKTGAASGSGPGRRTTRSRMSEGGRWRRQRRTSEYAGTKRSVGIQPVSCELDHIVPDTWPVRFSCMSVGKAGGDAEPQALSRCLSGTDGTDVAPCLPRSFLYCSGLPRSSDGLTLRTNVKNNIGPTRATHGSRPSLPTARDPPSPLRPQAFLGQIRLPGIFIQVL